MARYDDINTTQVALTGFVSALLLFAVIVAVQVLYYNYVLAETNVKVIQSPNTEADSAIAEQEAALTTYGWLDRQAGKVQIPIDRAKQLVLEELGSSAGDSAPASADTQQQNET